MPYRLDEAGWCGLLDRARQNDWRGQIVGAHGSGKTTLLEALERRLGESGIPVRRIVLHSWDRTLRVDQLVGDAVILCDGAEQLSAIDALRLRWRARAARGLIVTVHRTGAWGPVLYRCETSPALLQELVGSLGLTIPPGDAAALHARHRGDIRLALRELYDAVRTAS